jgi:hypothetical protein
MGNIQKQSAFGLRLLFPATDQLPVAFDLQPILICNRDDKVVDVFKGLIKHNVLSVPVMTADDKKYHGVQACGCDSGNNVPLSHRWPESSCFLCDFVSCSSSTYTTLCATRWLTSERSRVERTATFGNSSKRRRRSGHFSLPVSNFCTHSWLLCCVFQFQTKKISELLQSPYSSKNPYHPIETGFSVGCSLTYSRD